MAYKKPVVIGPSGEPEQLQPADQLVDGVGAIYASGTSVSVVQDTHLSVVNGDSGEAVGSTNPKTFTRSFDVSMDFSVLPVTVLRLEPGAQDQTRTLCTFDAGDASRFVADPCVQFGGTLSPCTTYQVTMSDLGAVDGGGYAYKAVLDTSTMDVTKVVQN